MHLLTILVSGSYLTLAVFSEQNAEMYIWWYVILVLILQIAGLLFPQGQKNGR